MAVLKKISLKDIAEAAGVSTALVSFVLNGKEKEYRVGEETAQRILKIATEMNYQPNLAAKKQTIAGGHKNRFIALNDRL